MRVLVCAWGTKGDLHPLVAVASALRERGHEVILLANPAYQELAIEAKIDFEAVGRAEDLAGTLQKSNIWNLQRGWRIWVQDAALAPMRDLYDAIERLNRPGETLVVASYLCFGARLAQEKLDLPLATLHLNVHTIRTRYNIYALPSPAFLPEFDIGWFIFNPRRALWHRIVRLWFVDQLFVNPNIAPAINRTRRQLGLGRLRQFVRDWWTSPELSIGLFPDWWSEEHPDWPATMVTTSFPVWDRQQSQELSDELSRFLDAEPVLVYSPGVSPGHSQHHFDVFEQACQQLDRRGLIITPHPPTELQMTPNVRFERYVPFSQLLPYASAVVHHAGIGTTALCLRAGVPQVAVPSIYNTPDTAARLERLGVSRTLRWTHFTTDRLTAALTDVTTSTAVAEACSRYQQQLAGDEPLSDICRHIEALGGRRLTD